MWQPTPVFLPGKSHGQRSLVGYSPWDHRIRHDWAQHTHTHSWKYIWVYVDQTFGAMIWFLSICVYEYACVPSNFSRVWFFATLWTVAHQVTLSMGFFRQEYWSQFSCPSPGDLPDPGIEPMSFMSPALAGRFFTTSTTLYTYRNTYSKGIWTCH